MKNYNNTIVSILLMTFLTINMGSGFAQGEVLTGNQSDADFGVSFNIPDGMKGAGAEGLYMFASESDTGLVILILDVEYTLEELEDEFIDEIYLDDVNSYYLSGDLGKIGSNSISGKFEHTLHGKINGVAHIIGTVGPHSQCAIIIANPVREAYLGRYKNVALEILESLKYSSPTFSYDDY